MFMYAWSASPHVHWIVQVIAIIVCISALSYGSHADSSDSEDVYMGDVHNVSRSVFIPR